MAEEIQGSSGMTLPVTEHRRRVNGISIAFFEWGRAFQGQEFPIESVEASAASLPSYAAGGTHLWGAVTRRQSTFLNRRR